MCQVPFLTKEKRRREGRRKETKGNKKEGGEEDGRRETQSLPHFKMCEP